MSLPLSIGTNRITPGVDSRYSAFPGACMLGGNVFAVWREGTDHSASRDGVIMSSTSADLGLTWGPASVLLSEDGVDLRDPNVSVPIPGGPTYLTYFKATASSAASGFFVQTSYDSGASFGSESRIDGGQPYAAGTSPIVSTGSGLLAVWYGKSDLSEQYDSVWASLSQDGSTWSAPVRVVSGPGIGMDAQEPWAAVSGDTVVVTYRHGTSANIGSVTSPDGGQTWGTGAARFPGSGRPSTVLTADGTLLCAYRANPASAAYMQHGYVRASHDLGTTWTQPRLLERAASGPWTYAAPLLPEQGQALVISSVEQSPTSAVLSARYASVGGSGSPFGDPAQGRLERISSRLTHVAAFDSFDREDGPLGLTENGVAWSAPAAVAVNGGSLHDTTSTGNNFTLIDALSADVDIEAEFQWNGSTSAIYFLARIVDTSNYYMAGVETSGANARIYRISNGAAVQLATAPVSVLSGHWYRLRFSAVGNALRFYLEDQLVASGSDGSFPYASAVGLRTGSGNANTDHRVRNLIVRARSGVES